MQPGPLNRAGVRRGHRHAAHQGGIRCPESEPPEPPVGRRAEPGVGDLPVHREQAGGELRRVHANQQCGSMYRGEGAGQALIEAVAALGHDVEPGRQPRSRLTVEHQHPAARWRGEHGVQGVGQRGLGQGGGLPGGARRHEAGLDPSGHRLLGDDEQGGARSRRRRAAPGWRGHLASTRLMSLTVRTEPRTVPVTLDLPMRGR